MNKEKDDILLVEDAVLDGMGEYAKELLLNRAIPRVQDGLKPVQRRIIYTMNDMGIYHDKKTVKCSRIVGETMGKYHPHGDCLGEDTKFLLTNGTYKTIYEMYLETLDDPNKTYEIYSVNQKTGDIVIGLMRNVRIGQYSNEIYNIKFSNGKIIKSTSNHPFMLPNLTFAQAKDLKEKDFLLRLENNIDMDCFINDSIHIDEINIEYLDKEIPMYDFTVDDYENAVVMLSDTDLIVAHNSSIYDALIVLSRDWVQRVPLIDIQGNNGNIDGSEAAAPRYTEARLTKLSSYLTVDMNKDSVEFLPNYDGSTKEPSLLPSTIPLALINGSYGVSIGYEPCSILPHNPIEIVQGLIEFVKNENITNKELLKYIKGFDFPTGGIIINPESIEDEMENGKAKVILRGKVRKVVNKKESYLEIYEIPCRVSTIKFIESVLKAIEPSAKALKIESVDDLGKGDDICIRISCQKGTELKTLDLIEQLLYKKSELQKNITASNIMISSDNHIKYFSILEYFKEFVNFRYETNRNIFKFNLDKVNSQIEIQDAIKIAINNIDEIIKLAKKATSANDLKEKLLENFKEFTEKQAEYISTIPLYRIGEIKKAEELLGKLLKEKEDIETFLSDKKVQQKYLLNNLKDILKVFEKDETMQRRTDIIKTEQVKEVEIAKEDLMEKKLMRVVALENQKVFQMGTKAFENQLENFKDTIIFTKECYTTDTLIITTKNGIGISLLVGELETSNLNNPNATELFKNYKKVTSDDEIIGCFICNNDEKALLCTEQGFYKEFSSNTLSSLLSVRGKHKSLSGLKVEGDKIIFFGKLDKSQIKVTFKAIKSGNILEKEIKLKDRDDGFGGSGTKYININGKIIQKISF